MKKIAIRFLGAFSLALFCLAWSTGQAWAEEYTLTWDPNTEPGVAGYTVHWGPESRHYTFQKDVGKQTSCTVTNLQDDTVYYFAVTAYDSSGRESDYSVEVAAVPRYFLFGIDGSKQDGGWIEVLDPDYEHLHWLQTDWSEYNSQGGEMRVVTGDIDGDQLDELIIGFGPVAGVSQGRFWVLDHDYTHLAWGRVDWPEYNARNGETWPATGDLDGDGRDDILIGLGAGGEGRVYMFALLNGDLVSNGFFEVGWSEYRSLVGEVRPATGDLDGDGRDEVILGLGSTNGFSGLPGGRYQILDHDRTHLAWGQVEWPDYNAFNGETRPATGDLDGDGRAEVLLGLGQGGGGMVQVVSLSQGKPVHRTWLNVGWDDYSTYNGETRPVAEDLDLDGLDEVLVGLGNGSQGRNLIFDDLENALAFQIALELWPEDYSLSYGGSWPSVQRRFETVAENGLADGPGAADGEPGTLARYLPHLTGDDMAWSDVLEIDNSGQSSAPFTLTLYQGASTVFEDVYTVEANAYLAIGLDALAPQATCGRVSFDNPGLTFRLAYENTQSDGVAGFLLDAKPSFQLSFLFSNFSEMVAWKGLGVMNTGNEQAEITLSAYGEGKLLRQTTSSLAPLSKSVGLVETLFPGLTVHEVDRVQAVSSGSPITGITITGSDDSDKLLFAPSQTTAALHPRAPSSSVNIPHLTGGDPNWLDMLEVDNPGSHPQTFTIFLYHDGRTVFQETFEVPPYGYRSIPLKDLACDADCGKVSFTSPDLKFRLAYEYSPSGGVAGFVLNDDAANQLSFLFSNFAATLDWKGLAVLNTHASPVTVDLTAYGEGGSLLGETELTVPGFSRSVGYVTEYFEGLGLESIEKVVARGEGAQLSGISITGSHWNDKMLFAPALQD